MNNDFIVRMIQLPGDISGAVRIDENGFASIYINDDLSAEARRRAFYHEIRHIIAEDMYSDDDIRDIEHRAEDQGL